jgi:pyruvate,water dikinase
MSSILWFDQLGMADLPAVGGKNASLGEMVSHLSAPG